MKNDYRKFSEYLEKTRVAKANNEIKLASKDTTMWMYLDDYYRFSLSAEAIYPASIMISRYNEPLIFLDEEDIEYFKSKYLPKIEEQYRAEMAELRNKYNK